MTCGATHVSRWCCARCTLLALVREASVSQRWYEAVLTWFGAVCVDTWRDDVQYVVAAGCHVGVRRRCEHVVLVWSRMPEAWRLRRHRCVRCCVACGMSLVERRLSMLHDDGQAVAGLVRWNVMVICTWRL